MNKTFDAWYLRRGNTFVNSGSREDVPAIYLSESKAKSFAAELTQKHKPVRVRVTIEEVK